MVALVLALFMKLALAAQTGEVLRANTTVFQYPNPTSPKIGSLDKGQRVPISNQMVRGAGGFYWYKVRLPSGEMGYALADAVKADSQAEDLHVSGLDLAATEAKVVEDKGWAWSLRAMGFGAYNTVSKGGHGGGEGELSLSPFLAQRGYARRRFAVGAVYAAGNDYGFVGGSLIYRFFTENRLAEPEFRARIGQQTVKDYLGIGFNVGARHPFTFKPSPQFAFSWELGCLFSVTHGTRDFLASASAGVGFYF